MSAADSQEVRPAPALTPEQWRDLHHNDEQLTAYVSWWGLVRESRGDWERGNLGELVAPQDISRHALAALCLHEQPFGFTRDDARELERVALLLRDLGYVTASSPPTLESVASRIRALLPPEKP